MVNHLWGKYRKVVDRGYVEENLGVKTLRFINPLTPKIVGIGYTNGKICYFGDWLSRDPYNENITYKESPAIKKSFRGYLVSNVEWLRGDTLPRGADFLEFGGHGGNGGATATYSKSNYRIEASDSDIQYDKSTKIDGEWENFSEIIGIVYYLKEKITTSKGSYLGDVKSTNANAYPKDGVSGDYWYVYKGIDNQAPTISGRDEDLGDKNTPFKQSFTVNDGDSGNILKVTVKLNSATIRTIENANRNETYYVDIDKIKFEELEPNRQNTITVTVDDGNGASANRRWTFTKKNTPPTVRVEQSNKGEQNSPFSFTFTPDDADGDVITGKIFLDDVQIEDLGTLTKKQEKTVKLKKLDFAKLTNGEHKIRIEITDIKGGKGYGYVEFTKKLTNCWYEFKKEIEGQATEIIVNPSVQIADGAKLTIKVCNNANDSSPAWEVVPSEQVGKSYTFKNRSKVSSRWAIGVNLRIDRGSAKEDSYLYGFVGNYQ